AFSFPMAYFERHNISHDWRTFLDDFQHHWPTDEDNASVEFLRDGNLRTGEPTWFRLTEHWTAAAKSVFRFNVQGQVAMSTHAGLPWLRYLRQQCKGKIHFWPFDGWEIPAGRSAVVEVYPSLWMRRFPKEARDNDQHAAYAVAAWLERVDRDGTLSQFLKPTLEKQERKIAEIEGWILGLV
ncbi:MAG: hypothetical protein ABI623_09800, partial [bacterium]